MTPNQTEISSASWTGPMAFPRDYSANAGFLVGPVNNQIDSISVDSPNIKNVRTVWQFTTIHDVSKITFKVIPTKNAETIQFDVNDVNVNVSKKDNWDGTLTNAETVVVEFASPTTDFTFTIGWLKNNQMAIVGMTFEW